MAKRSLKFYDVKARRSFNTIKYKTTVKIVKGRKKTFAFTTSPLTGIEAWRVI